MKTTTLYFSLLLLMTIAGCKKNDHGTIKGGGCPVPMKLTGILLSGSTQPGKINPDGSYIVDQLTWFNNGLLAEYVGPTDTVILDSIGRLLYFKWPFNTTGRQTAKYFYDNNNRVIRTVTNTGNGLDYLQDLVYQHGDVVEMAYSVGTASNHFYYSFYDTLCPHPFFGMQSWSQLGTTVNTHLIKSSWVDHDTTYYTYLIDSNKRILARYNNYDNSGWTYSRRIDTTYFVYSCE